MRFGWTCLAGALVLAAGGAIDVAADEERATERRALTRPRGCRALPTVDTSCPQAQEGA